MDNLNKEDLQSLFYYEDGCLYWKKAIGGTSKKDKKAGALNNKELGYYSISIYGKRYGLHRVIYAYHYGDIPPDMVIDHINNKPSDNRIENLRVVTRQENNFNMKNVRGFSETKYGYKAVIKFCGKEIYLGTYKTEKEAKQAYMIAKKVVHTIEER